MDEGLWRGVVLGGLGVSGLLLVLAAVKGYPTLVRVLVGLLLALGLATALSTLGPLP